MKTRLPLYLFCLLFLMPGIANADRDDHKRSKGAEKGKPFKYLKHKINDLQQQIDTIELTPGPVGPAGPPGPQGIPGVKGDDGLTGVMGLTGLPGPKGDAGANGSQGIQGLKGDTGATGLQGIQGLKGDTGAIGLQGIQGLKGDTGAAGLQGIQGPKGDKGNTGATGATGSTGPAGSSGGNPLSILTTWFNQPELINKFPVDAFNALQCSRSGDGGIRVTLGGIEFEGIAFIGFDAISQTHAYFVAFVTATLIDSRAFAAADASVTIDNGVQAGQFSGMVTEGGLVASDASGFTYGIKIEPRLSILSKSRDYDIYQDQSISGIVEEELQSVGINNFTINISRSLPQHEFVMQYNQSDLEFISNRMEHEGISYYFSDNGDIIITDVPGTGLVNSIYTGHLSPRGSLLMLNRAAGIAGLSFTVDSYDFRRPNANLQSTVTNSTGIGATFQFEQSALTSSDTATRAGILRSRSLSAADRLSGGGNLPAFRSGKITSINDKVGNLSGKYLLTRVDHVALKNKANNCVTYANRFDATIENIPYRPPLRTPKPTVHGITTAVVTGAAGSTFFVDEYGRVKVQFPWDQQGSNDEQSSGWIRVMLPAGRIEDELFIPLVGDEVVVSFFEGDPDRPIVLGTVYNDVRRPPVPLPGGLFP